VKTASEMTYIVAGGVLNSTQSNPIILLKFYWQLFQLYVAFKTLSCSQQCDSIEADVAE